MELPKCKCGNPITTRQRVCCSRACWELQREQAVLDLFWSRVDKTPGCWIWTGPVGAHGYGLTGKNRLSHRKMWELVNGRAIPKGMLVQHACDVPLCVRPEHLSLGTDLTNKRDAKSKGRVPEGHYRVTNPRLTPDEVRMIRAKAAAGQTQRSLATEYGMFQSSISAIVTRKWWREVE